MELFQKEEQIDAVVVSTRKLNATVIDARRLLIHIVEYMKKIAIFIFALYATLITCSCSTSPFAFTGKFAETGDTVQEYTGFKANKQDLVKATLLALKQRGWKIESDTLPIKAKYTTANELARVTISIQDGVLKIDTIGSFIDSTEPYYPEEHVVLLAASVSENLEK